jgi:hypothetical protein
MSWRTRYGPGTATSKEQIGHIDLVAFGFGRALTLKVDIEVP